MSYNPLIHHRQSTRLQNYDYSTTGTYFITICAFERQCLFGAVVEAEMRLNIIGEVVSRCWHDIQRHFPHVALDEFVVMPNHLHGLIHIIDCEDKSSFHTSLPVGTKQASPSLTRSSGKTTKGKADEPFSLPLQDKHGTAAGSLGAIVQNFKSISSRKINKINDQCGVKIWQRNYYDRIIRNETELETCRDYIANNPLKWALDDNNPAHVGAKQDSPASPCPVN